MENLTSLVMPHGPWFIYEPYAREQFELLSRVTLQEHAPDKAAHVARLRAEATELKAFDEDIAPSAARAGEKPYDMRDGIACFDLTGPMTKNGSSWGGGGSTAQLRRLIEVAANDAEVKGALIRVDSPGGSVAGTDDLARAVSAFARKKPIYAYIEDLGASAAAWVSFQATKVFANPTALVGSLGTYSVVYDMSRRAENDGIKVSVLSTGKYKGAGTPGAPVTDEQIANFQQTVDDLNEHFISAVSRGRNMPKGRTRELFTGEIHGATKALELGLIDGVSSYGQVFQQVRQDAFRAEEHSDTRATFEAIFAEVEATETIVISEEETERRAAVEEAFRSGILTAEEAQAELGLPPVESIDTNTISSDEVDPLTGSTLAADFETALTAFQVARDRVEGLKALRLSQNRSPLSAKAIGYIDNTVRQLRESADELEAIKPLSVAETSDLQREILAAEISLAS